jgi:hypothetical protein
VLAEVAGFFQREVQRLIRRRIAETVSEPQLQGFYFCSLSCRTLIDKGLFQKVDRWHGSLTSTDCHMFLERLAEEDRLQIAMTPSDPASSHGGS